VVKRQAQLTNHVLQRDRQMRCRQVGTGGFDSVAKRLGQLELSERNLDSDLPDRRNA
jgi:hypothetical protein